MAFRRRDPHLGQKFDWFEIIRKLQVTLVILVSGLFCFTFILYAGVAEVIKSCIPSCNVADKICTGKGAFTP
jgi:hypothetical protein